MQFKTGQHVHFVGIGGAGLSAIARILLERGFKVSGSDRTPNALTDALSRDGATIYTGHAAENIAGADMLIVTSAVKDNPEISAAHAAGIPVYKRQEIMAALMEGYYVIAVAGTHGKTTTTAMITHLLREVGVDPCYIVGGIMINTGTNAGVGKGDVFVIEADEYDNMFLGLRPNMIVLTTLEYDHPDFFKSEAEMVETFRKFIALLPEESHLFACTDDPLVRQVAAAYPGPVGAYGFQEPVLFMPGNIQNDPDGYTTFDIQARDVNTLELERVGRMRLALPGLHNVLNATGAAFCVIMEVAGRPRIIAKHVYDAMESFKGTVRRFEVRGEANGVVIVDDYAHHPTAIKATIQAARSRYPDHKIYAVWQPHTFSRTSELLPQYVTAFRDADAVLMTDVYAARENTPDGHTVTSYSAEIAGQIQHPHVTHTPTLDDAAHHLLMHVNGPAVVVIMSAGDAPKIGEAYLKAKGGA